MLGRLQPPRRRRFRSRHRVIWNEDPENAVLARDHGICAGCGIDAELEYRRALTGRWHSSSEEEKKYLAGLMLKGFPRPGDKPWWEADHIIPCIEGGQHTMENLRREVS